jgi:protein involved in polysaccharide export with SLBB domain
VGSQDVLEIRLNSSQSKHATVFKVTQSGLLEHPQLSGPLSVTGLTVEEISARIENDLKNQASIENPKAFVGVVEYASHSIVVDGLVKSPGTKSLKSEAIPLAIVVAEAQPLSEAARVTVVRNGDQILETDLNSTADTRLLVRPGDVVTLHPQMNAVIHVSGKVKFPGEKTYRFGLTLTQAIIMAGGPTSNSSVAEIVRDGDEAVRTRFDLKAIMAGKAADPLIKAGDRIILH